MSPAPWLEVALRELVLGVEEISGRQHHARILEYHQATSLGASDDETSWCAAFVNWCLRQAWLYGTNSASARRFETWGEACDARPGAIVTMWRGASPSWQGHVGFYLGRGATTVLLLGGNQGNAVSVAPFDASRVTAYRWPRNSSAIQGG